MEESPFALIGTPEQMIEDSLARPGEWGFSYLIVGADDIESFAPVVAALAGERDEPPSRVVRAPG